MSEIDEDDRKTGLHVAIPGVRADLNRGRIPYAWDLSHPVALLPVRDAELRFRLQGAINLAQMVGWDDGITDALAERLRDRNESVWGSIYDVASMAGLGAQLREIRSFTKIVASTISGADHAMEITKFYRTRSGRVPPVICELASRAVAVSFGTRFSALPRTASTIKAFVRLDDSTKVEFVGRVALGDPHALDLLGDRYVNELRTYGRRATAGEDTHAC